MRLELAHYNEMKAFARFGAGLDSAGSETLRRGERIVEIFKQKNYSPERMSDMVLQLFIIKEDLTKDYPISEQRAVIADFLRFVDGHGGVFEEIETTGVFSDTTKEYVRQLFVEFAEGRR